MKNLFIISISVIFIYSGMSSLTLVEASRLKYHNYFLGHHRARVHSKEVVSPKETRKFSERIYPYSLSLSKRREEAYLKEKNNENIAGIRMNLRYSQENTRNTYKKTNVDQLLRARSENALRWSKQVKRVVSSSRNTGGDVRAMETFENDHFSIQVPLSWDPIEGAAHFFRSKKMKGFTISVEKIADSCDSISFTACSIAFSKNANHKQAYFITSKIKRVGRNNFTVLNSDKTTATFTESFFATKGDPNEEVFINRFFVEDLSGGVFLVETKAPANRAFDFIGTSKYVFNSFRFFKS